MNNNMNHALKSCKTASTPLNLTNASCGGVTRTSKGHGQPQQDSLGLSHPGELTFSGHALLNLEVLPQY